jgi:hypothetical protein
MQNTHAGAPSTVSMNATLAEVVQNEETKLKDDYDNYKRGPHKIEQEDLRFLLSQPEAAKQLKLFR